MILAAADARPSNRGELWSNTCGYWDGRVRLGSHAKRLPHQPGERHSPGAFEIGLARFEAHMVRMIEPQLGDILDRDDPVGRARGGQQRCEERRLAGARRPRDEEVGPLRDEPTKVRRDRGVEHASLLEIGETQLLDRGEPDRDQRPFAGDRRQNRVDANAAGPPHVGAGCRIGETPE